MHPLLQTFGPAGTVGLPREESIGVAENPSCGDVEEKPFLDNTVRKQKRLATRRFLLKLTTTPGRRVRGDDLVMRAKVGCHGWMTEDVSNSGHFAEMSIGSSVVAVAELYAGLWCHT